MTDSLPLPPTAPAPIPGKRVTIVDVAHAAGVSVSSASRALNKPGRLNAETEQRVKDAARALGYRPNPAARALPTGRTGTIAIVVANIANPIAAHAIRGAESAARAAGYTLLIHEFRELEAGGAEESERIARLASVVDGFVLPLSDASDESVKKLASARPSVMVNRDIELGISVSGKPESALKDLFDELVPAGHSRFVYVSGPARSWINRERFRAASAQAAAHGVELVKVGPFEPTREGGVDAAGAVIGSGASAVVTYNDLMAIGLLFELQALGKRVPEDYSIVGFDNIFGSDFTSPPLTTIHVPLEEMTCGATERLVALLEGREPEGSLQVDTTLISRGSTAAFAS